MKDPIVHIDTVRLSVDLDGSPDRSGASAHVRAVDTAEEAWEFSKRLPSGAVATWGKSQRVQVEFSAPKLLNGHNVEGLPIGQAVEVAREVWSELPGQGIDVRGRFEDSYVNRLDLDRDFDQVTRIASTLTALAGARMKGRATGRLFRDGSRAGALTLTKGNAARQGTLYDKHGEVMASEPKEPKMPRGEKEAASYLVDMAAYKAKREVWQRAAVLSEGRLRFEARLRIDPLRTVGVERVLHLVDVADAEERLGRLRRGVFEWCGYQREVSGMAKLTDVVMGSDDLTNTEKVYALGYLILEAQGREVPMHRNSERKYRRIAESLGIVGAGTTAELLSGTVSLGLDYDTGREVMRVA